MGEVMKEKVNDLREAAKCDIIICSVCKNKNRGTALYCRCGTALNNECSRCCTRNLISVKFCGKCSAKLL